MICLDSKPSIPAVRRVGHCLEQHGTVPLCIGEVWGIPVIAKGNCGSWSHKVVSDGYFRASTLHGMAIRSTDDDPTTD